MDDADHLLVSLFEGCVLFGELNLGLSALDASSFLSLDERFELLNVRYHPTQSLRYHFLNLLELVKL